MKFDDVEFIYVNGNKIEFKYVYYNTRLDVLFTSSVKPEDIVLEEFSVFYIGEI